MRHPWKLVASAIVLAVLQACGGGGGGDGGDGNGAPGDDSAPTMPTTLAFSGGLIDGVPMAVSAAGQSLSVTSFGFKGTWDRTANRYTLPANETFLSVNSEALGARVTAAASWVGFAPPVESGTLSAQSPLFTGIAAMTALSDTQVQLSWTGTTPTTTVNYSWDTFLNELLPTDWEIGIQAAFGAAAHGVEKVQFALDQFVFINTYDAQLATAGAAGVTQACAGGAGTRKVVWSDTNGDGALGPGDGFSVTFASCRIDMPGDIDQVLDGQIVISGYIENSSPFSVGGRVDFVGLRQAETDVQGISLSTTGSMQLFISGV